MHYVSVHRKLRRVRGRAPDHPCFGGCGNPAEQWAYQRAEATQFYEGFPYSEDLSDYEPMCRSCHRKMDIAKLPEAQRKAFDEASRQNIAKGRAAIDRTDPVWLEQMRIAGSKGGSAKRDNRLARMS